MKKNPLRLKSVNHISIVCNSVEKSLEFYHKVLGFHPVQRPASFTFHGAWLFNYGMGIHLLQSDHDSDTMPKKRVINPKDNHLSFQSEDMATTEKQLKKMKIEYVKCEVEDDGIFIDQLFFHDPDGLMIEICNCENLPILPVSGGGDSPIAVVNAARLCSIQQAEQQQKLQQIQNAAVQMMQLQQLLISIPCNACT
ncbi:uncharacterized protein LOC111461685 [Cucurbita moschata]|uniref:Uncharacterized protein LOC111461685 n=1 Tax=Cucurbita moschata TaxID=3662 RepID=A0A6J1HAX4_CUCMO|nr:uncharacterized protein LOC111461685 [Cucurbita moschata]